MCLIRTGLANRNGGTQARRGGDRLTLTAEAGVMIARREHPAVSKDRQVKGPVVRDQSPRLRQWRCTRARALSAGGWPGHETRNDALPGPCMPLAARSASSPSSSPEGRRSSRPGLVSRSPGSGQ